MALENDVASEEINSKAEPKVVMGNPQIPALHFPSLDKPSQPHDQAMAPQSCAVPCEQQLPHTPTGYAGYTAHQIASPNIITGALSPHQMLGAAAAWQSQQFPYGLSPQMPSPSMTSNASFSPGQGLQSPGHDPILFPDSPQLMDASQMLRSPSRFRKRRQLSPLISGYTDPTMGSPQQPTGLAGSMSPFLRRMSMPKIPVSPSASSTLHALPRSRDGNLILPCFFDNNNNLRVHGPHSFHHQHHQHGVKATGNATSYWDDSRRTILSFLKEAEAIDEENITIIEIKQLLRRYSLSATGKKTVLMDRIRRAQAHFKADMEREEQMVAQTLASNSPKSKPVHSEDPGKVGVAGSSSTCLPA